MTILLISVLLATLILAFILIGFSLRHSDRLKTVYFTIVTSATAVYILGYLLEIMAPDLSAAKTALIVENLGIPMLAPFFLLLVLTICEYHVRPWMQRTAMIYGFSIFLCVLFNDYHHLYYTEIRQVTGAGIRHLIMGYGPLYILNQTVAIMLMGIAYVALFMRVHSWSPRTRQQMRFVIIGSLVAFMGNIFNYLRISPGGLDISPFTSLLASLLFSISIFRYKLFDIVPVATEYAIQTMDDALIVLDKDWNYLFSNQSAKRLFSGLDKLYHADSIEQLPNWPQNLPREKGSFDFTLPGTDNTGTERIFRANISTVQRMDEPAALGWSIVIRDTTEFHDLMNRLETLARTDALTQIYNRRHFRELVVRELELSKRHPRKMAMLMFDLDHFKTINDTYGHLVGDEVLKAVVLFVKSELRSYDIFARYGGEEFVIFTIHLDEEAAERMAWRLCRSIAALNISVDGISIQVTASFGVTEMHARDSIEDAYTAVDKALYRAKTGGRNCVVVERVSRGSFPGSGQVIDMEPKSAPSQLSTEEQ